MVSNLMAKAMKNESAVLGLDNVLSVLQEQRVMRLVMRRGLAASGYSCTACGALSVQRIDSCPYCKGAMEMVDRIVNLAGEKAIQQGAVVEVVEEDSPLKNVGGIGAFLRY
jgi:peptide subunit release factor 1 (eRF1)